MISFLDGVAVAVPETAVNIGYFSYVIRRRSEVFRVGGLPNPAAAESKIVMFLHLIPLDWVLGLELTLGLVDAQPRTSPRKQRRSSSCKREIESEKSLTFT
jgi:hypothetical protein